MRAYRAGERESQYYPPPMLHSTQGVPDGVETVKENKKSDEEIRMNIEQKVTEIMKQVTRRDVSEVFGKALCEAKRENQRFFGGADDQRTKPEIMADCLLAVYRAGLYDGMRTATEDFSDDGR